MNTIQKYTLLSIGCLATLAICSVSAPADDWPMWGRTPQRENISPEKNPPTEWDVDTGLNIKWSAQLGSQSYGNAIVADGFVVCGTNNEAKRDPSFTGDAGVLTFFDANTGKFLYQRTSPKLQSGRVNDWPFQGVCSTSCVEGDRLWYCTNRCEVVCLDLAPLKQGQPPKQIWSYDMMKGQGVFPHNMTACSTTYWGDYIYIITGNGVDESHKNVPAPNAPSIICFNKNTGKVVWTDNTPGNRILHGEWASPAIATVNGRTQVIAPLGDGWIYAYDAKTGEIIWRFDSNNKDTVYPTTRNELIATPAVYGNYCYIANGQDPEHGEGPGHLWCIDITKTGDVSLELPADKSTGASPGQELLAAENGISMHRGKPNPNSAVVWHFDKLANIAHPKARDRMNRSISTVAVTDGLVFAPDFSGYLHCLDAKTGHHYWTHDMESAMWGSPVVIDGKVYLCDEEGDVSIFPVSRELDESKIITHNMGSASYCTPVFANGTLYVMTREKMFAISDRK